MLVALPQTFIQALSPHSSIGDEFMGIEIHDYRILVVPFYRGFFWELKKKTEVSKVQHDGFFWGFNFDSGDF